MGNQQSRQLTWEEEQAALQEGRRLRQEQVKRAQLAAQAARARREPRDDCGQKPAAPSAPTLPTEAYSLPSTNTKPLDATTQYKISPAALSCAEETEPPSRFASQAQQVAAAAQKRLLNTHFTNERRTPGRESIWKQFHDPPPPRQDKRPPRTSGDRSQLSSSGTSDLADIALAAFKPRKERLVAQETTSTITQPSVETLAAVNLAITPSGRPELSGPIPSRPSLKRISADEETIDHPGQMGPLRKKLRSSFIDSEMTATPQPPASINQPQSSTTNETRPPEWLQKYAHGRSSKLEANSKSLTISLKKEISKAKKGSIAAQESFPLIHDKLHKLFFILVDEQTVRNNRLLSNEDGLPQIFDDKYADGVQWPFDIRADAKELYTKWSDRIFETDLLRDINVGKPKDANAQNKKDGSKDVDEGGSSVKEGKRVSSKYIGDGKLLNGQWWPTLLCANRDGAHGETIAGISGEPGKGAYSCFISGGADVKYPDKDLGDVVEYCGIDNKTSDGSVTRGTQMLLDSHKNSTPVRFIRSSKARLDGKSTCAPQCGFRYDGLYDVVGFEVLNCALGRHRFRLVRREGQGPIRGGWGPEARPTREEVEAYDKDKRLRGFKT